MPAPGTDDLPADARIFLLDEGGQWRAGRREGRRLLFEALNPGRYTGGPSEALAAIPEPDLRSLPIVLVDGQALELPFDPAWTPAPDHLQVVLLQGGPPAGELRLAQISGSLRPLSPTRIEADRAYFLLAPGSQGQGLIVLHPPSDEGFGRRILAEGPRGAPIVLSAGQLVLEVALAGAAAELDPAPRLGPLAQLLATSKPRLAAAAAAPNAQAFDAFRFLDGPGLVDLGWFPAGELTLLARCLRAPGVAASAGERRSFVTQELDLTLGPGETRRVRIELELE